VKRQGGAGEEEGCFMGVGNMFDWGESDLMGRVVQSLHRGNDRTVTVQ